MFFLSTCFSSRSILAARRFSVAALFYWAASWHRLFLYWPVSSCALGREGVSPDISLTAYTNVSGTCTCGVFSDAMSFAKNPWKNVRVTLPTRILDNNVSWTCTQVVTWARDVFIRSPRHMYDEFLARMFFKKTQHMHMWCLFGINVTRKVAPWKIVRMMLCTLFSVQYVVNVHTSCLLSKTCVS